MARLLLKSVLGSVTLSLDLQVVGGLVVGEDLGHLPVPRCQVSDFILIGSELK